MRFLLLTALLSTITTGCVNVGKACIGIGPSCAVSRLVQMQAPLGVSNNVDTRPLSCKMYYDCSQMRTFHKEVK